MYKKIGKFLSIVFIATILNAIFAAKIQCASAETTTLAIIPQSIIDPSIGPDSTFRINASVAAVVDLFTWQVNISFRPTVLNAMSAFYPSDHVFAGRNIIPVVPVIDNVRGCVSFGASLIGDQPGFDGSGRLCQIEFKVVDRGYSGFNFSKPYGGDTFLLDSWLNLIPADVMDGYFDNRLAIPQPPIALFDYSPKPPIVSQLVTFDASASYDTDGTIVDYQWTFGDGGTASGKIATHTYVSLGQFQVNLTVTDDEGLDDTETKEITVYESKPARLYIDPPEIIDPKLLPPQIVAINVTVSDVINMYDYEFNLSYNTEMLTCIGAIINRVQNQTRFTPLILIDDGAGYIWVNVTYYPPAKPITSTTPLALVTIYFQIDTLGASVLHLSDTELSDSSRKPITHMTEDGFIMTLIRDVAITHVATSTSWLYRGWPVDISVIAKNYGNISESFDVKIYYDSNLMVTIPVVDLASNAEANLIYTWDTSGVSEGNYTISAEATTVPFEFNTTNNFFSDGSVQIFTVIRDVAIIGVTPSRNWVFPGAKLNITVTAKNVGETTESFDVNLYYDSNLIGTAPVVDLLPNTETILVFIWNTSGLEPCHNYTITGEATAIPYEYNTTNNILVDGTVKIRLVGDINGDNKVDMKDIAIVAAAFGSYPGHPRWNPEADVTGTVYLVPDGKVDMRDVALISRNFGKGCI